VFKKKKININRHLFYETSHSPSLLDIVGEKMLSKVIDFCFIANPYYPDKKLTRKMQSRLPVVMKSYPSSNPKLSLQNLAAVLNVKPEQLIIGNGATELITVIQKEFVDDLAIPIPTFSEYTEKLRKLDSAKLFQLPAHNQYALNLNEYADWIDEQKISSALIINPGNPTGQLFQVHEMIKFLERMKHLKLIILDESFIDFAHKTVPTLLPHIQQFPNVIIVRSMSKHCGVPGLRLGYCCSANQDYINRLKHLLPIWNINTVAEYFLTQLLATDKQYQETRLKVLKDVQALYNQLKDIKGITVYPTGSNFVMIRIDCGLTATEIQEKLLEDYFVYVRDCSNKIGLDKYHIRVASQGKRKDKFIVNALKKITQEKNCNG